MSTTLISIYALMFLAAVFLLEGISQLVMAVRNPQQKAINRRLRALESGDDPEEIYRLLRRRAGQDGWLGARLMGRFQSYVQQAGIALPMRAVLGAMAGLAAIATVVGMVGLRLAPAPAAGLGILILVAATVLVVASRRARRLATLETQLPDLLDLIVRSVRSGHPLSTALRLAAKEMPEPIGSELTVVVDEATYGVPLVDALDNLAGRVGIADYAYFAVAAKITSKTGGNLATILENLSHVIRDRGKLRRKIKAISAEGRISGVVMSLAPVGIGGIILLTSPDFFLDVADDPLFDRLLIMIGGLTVANYVALRRLVNFEF